jgi:hypothetical protein
MNIVVSCLGYQKLPLLAIVSHDNLPVACNPRLANKKGLIHRPWRPKPQRDQDKPMGIFACE